MARVRQSRPECVRAGGAPAQCATRPPVWQRRLGEAHGDAVWDGIHVTAAWPSERLLKKDSRPLFLISSMAFNVDNRLSSVVTTYAGTPTTSTFVYDGDGGRVKKMVGTTTIRYISKLYECETTGANTSCSRIIWANDTRIATVATDGTVHYWHGTIWAVPV